MSKHIVKSYDKELEELKNEISAMGRIADAQIRDVREAFLAKSAKMALRLIEQDPLVNKLEHDVNQLTVHMLAARQPLAVDLRTIISALKIATDLERIADYAKNIARQVIVLSDLSLKEEICKQIVDIIDIAKVMLTKVLEAYAESDVEKALEARELDKEVDVRYTDLLSALHSCMVSNAEDIESCTAMLFIGRCLERIGDHIQNISEDIYFIVKGELYTPQLLS
jgi:phosphate transport system protein